MASTHKWNRASGGAARPLRTGSRLLLRWIAVATVAVAAVGVIVWLLSDAKTSGESLSAKRGGGIADAGAVQEVKPSPQVQVQKPRQESPKERPPQRVGELRDGYRLLPDGTLHRVLGIVTNMPPKMSLADKTFTHSADIELGNLLMVEPGDDLLGSAEGLYRGFGKELDEALADSIEYAEDDTALQRELKDGVKELRDELRRRRDAGEDIEKVMESTWNQLKELSLYKQDLEDQVRSLSTESLTQKDYEDLVKAANEMLADRGIKPLEMPSTLKHALRLRKIQEEAANNQKEREDANETK